jgi:hypothetical protein
VSHRTRCEDHAIRRLGCDRVCRRISPEPQLGTGEPPFDRGHEAACDLGVPGGREREPHLASRRRAALEHDDAMSPGGRAGRRCSPGRAGAEDHHRAGLL